MSKKNEKIFVVVDILKVTDNPNPDPDPSVRGRYADPDSYQNFMDPQHW